MSDRLTPVDVSIIVVNWNVADLLDGCLQSVEAERQRSSLSFEVIVVDNASSERDVVDVTARYPKTRLIELEENRGYGAASNEGMSRARGAAMFILNPDVELLPGAVERLWTTLQLSPHMGLVAPLLLNADRSLQSAGYRFPGIANVIFDWFPSPARVYGSSLNGRIAPGNGELPVQIDYALGAALFIRQSALLDAGGFDESYFMYSEEIDLQRRLFAHGWTRLLDPMAQVIHYGGQSTSQRADEMQIALWASRAQYFKRWNSRFENLVIRLLVNAGTRLRDCRDSSTRRVNAEIRTAFNLKRTQSR